jgi:type IV pilus assembly protein PilO
MADTPKSTPLLLLLIALLIGYIGYNGAGLDLIGVDGVQARQERVVALRDTLEQVQAQVDRAKADLARESVEDVQARTEAYRASLGVLRSLVPEQREVANLIDDVNIRAKVHGLRVEAFTPSAPAAGPEPFDTHTYQFTVIGRYHQVGDFLTDVASLRRIMVPQGVTLNRAGMEAARMLGDTLSMLEASFSLKSYVKAAASAEEAPNGM